MTSTPAAFITSIPAGTPDDLLSTLLACFGSTKQWRRLADPAGSLKPSGFIDYADVQAVRACARLLPLVELYPGGGKRLTVKYEEAGQGGGVKGEESEEGEVIMGCRQADVDILERMIAVFSERRMLHAVESVKTLIKDYDRIVLQQENVGEADDTKIKKAEEQWLAKEAQIFRHYSEYLEYAQQPIQPDKVEKLFYADREGWKQKYPSRANSDAEMAQLAQSIPTDPHLLFSEPIDWARLDWGRMRKWLVRQRGLLPAQADIIAGYFTRRLSPEQIIECLGKDACIREGEEPELFTIRLWRWLLFDTKR